MQKYSGIPIQYADEKLLCVIKYTVLCDENLTQKLIERMTNAMTNA